MLNRPITSSDLLAMRMRLGLSRREAATILGLTDDDWRKRENARTWIIYADQLAMLAALERAFDAHLTRLIDRIEREGTEILISYPNDEVFWRMAAPDVVADLRLNSVHRMLLAQAQACFSLPTDATSREQPAPNIVEIVPTKFAGWIGDRADTDEIRTAWAKTWLAVYTVNQDEEQPA